MKAGVKVRKRVHLEGSVDSPEDAEPDEGRLEPENDIH